MAPRLLFALLISVSASPSFAQVMIDEDRLPRPWIDLTADLNKDGRPDRLISTPHSLDHDIISIALSGLNEPIFLPLWTNRTGEPGIALTSQTTFDLRTGCFACGRYHSEYLWRMAWRDGGLVVAGYRETVVDRLGPRVIVCDVNLRTGNADILVDGEVRLRPTGPAKGFRVQDLSNGVRPVQCAQTRTFKD